MTNSELDAARILPLIDLTNLNDDCTPKDIEALCARAHTPHGPVAAVCIWPQFVAQAVDLLKNTPVRVATVVNFPGGDDDRRSVLAETKQVVGDGVSEVDLVMPYRAFMSGDVKAARDVISMVRAATHNMAGLKIILETGEMADSTKIKEASTLALTEGADFIKTSTGKVQTNATLDAARVMLMALKDFGDPARGFKPAGGIRTVAEAQAYLALADEIMGPQWATPATFRFGASSLLDNVLAMLDGQEGPTASGGY